MRSFYLGYKDAPDLLKLAFQVPWSQNLLIISKVSEEKERKYYLESTINLGWSRAVLLNQIKGNAYGHHMTNDKQHNFKSILPTHLLEQAEEALKSEYNLDFLGLTKPVSERELENQLVENIRDLLMEMGFGFCFIGNQYRIKLRDKEYFLDLCNKVSSNLRNMEQIQILFNKANMYHNNGDYEQAISHYQKIIGQLKMQPKNIERQIRIANAELNLANSYRENKQDLRAIKRYKYSLSIYHELRKSGYEVRSNISKLYCDWSILKSNQGDYLSAIKNALKSLKLSRVLFKEDQEKYSTQLLISLYNIANIYQRAANRDSFLLYGEEFVNVVDNLNLKEIETIKRYKELKGKITFATNKEFSQLKQLDEIKAEIKLFIEKYKDKIPSPEEAVLIMQEFTNICGASIIKTQSRKDLEQFYFRIRPKGTMGHKEESQVSEFTYPPSNYTNHGRVNLPKQPVFMVEKE